MKRQIITLSIGVADVLQNHKGLRFSGMSYVYVVQMPSLLKQWHLMQADQDQVQGVRKYLLQGDSTTSPGNCVSAQSLSQ